MLMPEFSRITKSPVGGDKSHNLNFLLKWFCLWHAVTIYVSCFQSIMTVATKYVDWGTDIYMPTETLLYFLISLHVLPNISSIIPTPYRTLNSRTFQVQVSQIKGPECGSLLWGSRIATIKTQIFYLTWWVQYERKLVALDGSNMKRNSGLEQKNQDCNDTNMACLSW